MFSLDDSRFLLFLASFICVFFAPGASKMAAFALSLVVGLPLAGEPTYTKISLVAGLAGGIQEAFRVRRGPSLVPFLFVNSCAILAGFNAACDADPTAFERMAAKSGDSLGTFQMKHAAVHWLPPAIFYMWMVSDRERYLARGALSPFTGLVTAAFHIAWALANFGSLDLSEVYVDMAGSAWNRAWGSAVLAHILFGCSWRLIV